ncbi:acid protease [Sanghuangporus baumii]|uniref:Acid protease n=1 Tax=Sanghuangporus baumii TaxID=108892 RepID=A0A9Q5I050_SANBA|nr:acid protease [Sanghuangporus baumii]
MTHHHHVVIKALPMRAHLLKGGSAKQILAVDRARVQKLIAGHSPHGPAVKHNKALRAEVLAKKPFATAEATSIDVTDAAVTYTIQVGVGSPATDYTLLIDTGSSNTWVGADKKYVKTSTSKDTGKTVQVSYGSGSFSGEEYTDRVALGDELVIEQQGLGVARTAQGFDGVDGILGIGPVDLTEGTVKGNQPVPTVTDNLYTQGTIPTESIGISYNPTTGTVSSSNLMNGELTFGGTDSSKLTGEITYVPITSTSPASAYWGIDQSITYGNSETSILNTTAGIVDTGTTLLYLATDAFQAYQRATGATLDQTTGLLKLSASEYSNLQSLFFQIGGTTFEMTPNAQIWPRSLNSELGGDDDSIYLVAADNGQNSGQGLDFINGFVWLQRFYTIFDTTNSRVGIATTEFTDAETN